MTIEMQKAAVLPPVISTSATNATNSASFDTWIDGQAARHARLIFSLPAAQATNSSAKYTSLVVGHATTTHISNATALATGGTGTTNATATAAQFVLAGTNDTTNRSIQIMDVDLSTAERYLHITHQAATNYNTSIFVCVLSRVALTPTDATNIARASSGGYSTALP